MGGRRWGDLAGKVIISRRAQRVEAINLCGFFPRGVDPFFKTHPAGLNRIRINAVLRKTSREKKKKISFCWGDFSYRTRAIWVNARRVKPSISQRKVSFETISWLVTPVFPSSSSDCVPIRRRSRTAGTTDLILS